MLLSPFSPEPSAICRRRQSRCFLVVESEFVEDSVPVFLYPRDTGLRLFRPGEVEQVCPLPSRRKRFEGFPQGAVLVEAFPEFLRYRKVFRFFPFNFLPRYRDLDRLADAVAYRCFLFGYFGKVREADLAPGLYLVRLRDEDAVRIFQERAVDEKDRAVFLEAVDQRDVPPVKRIARLSPFEIFGQIEIEHDRPEFPELGLPCIAIGKKSVNIGFHGVLLALNIAVFPRIGKNAAVTALSRLVENFCFTRFLLTCGEFRLRRNSPGETASAVSPYSHPNVAGGLFVMS
jgi:hypothetical protein